MKKTLLLLLLFLTAYSISNAQSIIPFVNKYKNATIYFRDGTVKEGLGKITLLDDKIKFKANKKADKEIYDYRELDKITFKEKKEDKTYQYKIFKKKNVKKPQYPLLEIEVIGNFSLFSKEVTYTASTPGFGGHSFSVGGNSFSTPATGGFNYSNTYKVYYITKKNSDEVYFIFDKKILGGKFIKSARKYFEDCPLLVEKINSKEFKRNDIIEIIEFYNKNCGN